MECLKMSGRFSDLSCRFGPGGDSASEVFSADMIRFNDRGMLQCRIDNKKLQKLFAGKRGANVELLSAEQRKLKAAQVVNVPAVVKFDDVLGAASGAVEGRSASVEGGQTVVVAKVNQDFGAVLVGEQSATQSPTLKLRLFRFSAAGEKQAPESESIQARAELVFEGAALGEQFAYRSAARINEQAGLNRLKRVSDLDGDGVYTDFLQPKYLRRKMSENGFLPQELLCK